jgi:hypothetical protein
MVTMNAHTPAIELRDDSHHAAKRLIGALLLAFLLLNAMFSLAGAKPVPPFEGTQNDFTNECRIMGGTPKREATHIVSCTYPGGVKKTCDFNQKPASCTSTTPPKANQNSNGNVVVNDESLSTENIEQADMSATSPSEASGSSEVLVEDTQVANVTENTTTVPVTASEQPAVETSDASNVAEKTMSTPPRSRRQMLNHFPCSKKLDRGRLPDRIDAALQRQ